MKTIVASSLAHKLSVKIAAQIIYQYQHHQLSLSVDADNNLSLKNPKHNKRAGLYLFPIHFHANIVKQLIETAQSHGTTIQTLFLTAFNTLFYRYTGKDQITIGTFLSEWHSKRNVNYDISSSVLNYHQETTFAELVQQHNHNNHQVISAIPDIVFIYQTAANDSKTSYKVHHLKKTRDICPKIILSLIENATTISGIIAYHSDYFDKDFIDKLYHHLTILLYGIVHNFDSPVSLLSLLTSREKFQLIHEWNNTTCPYPKKITIDKLFEKCVASQPNAIAIVDGKDSYTFSEINKRANQLANYLLSTYGVKQQSIIAIGMERCVEFIIGILAILKIGAIYAPIDPSAPTDRLELMLNDIESQIILTLSPYQHQLQIKNSATICLDLIKHLLSNCSSENINLSHSSMNLAYILFTSGSTGKPKGVAITHRSINRVIFSQSYMQINQNTVLAHLNNIIFDASVIEIFSTLLLGAKLVIIKKDDMLNFKKLSTIIANNKINWMFFPTAYFHHLVDMDPSILKPLDYCLVAGEALDPKRAHVVRKYMHKHFINAYGPTEATVIASYYPLPPHVKANDVIPIGKPLANTTLYILDNHRQLMPIGLPGELYIGGPGVAQGYWKRPDLTKAKFIDDPFSQDPKAKLYKTGDICRYLPDGNIEYIGRRDFQVKIRGYRIELGDIEGCLHSHPHIKDAVVIAQEFVPGEKSLIAYIVLNHQSLTQQQIQDFVRHKLPSYMVPSHIIFINEMPISSTGKIDRKSLPLPKFHLPMQMKLAPRNSTEQKLLTLWQEVLHQQDIGINDNFFDLGGNSLLAAQLAFKLAKIFLSAFTFTDFLSHPTIETLASLIIPAKKRGANKILEQLKRDIAFVKPFRPATQNFNDIVSPKAILLTGATGFLGIHLLEALLKSTSATIYCLVRAKDNKMANQYLSAKMHQYHLSEFVGSPRVNVVCGDLSCSHLGLGDEEWSVLADNVDCIYHCAAHVNHIYDYSKLRKENVLSTIELIKLASEKRNKRIFYISTISAILDKDIDQNLCEQFPSAWPSGNEGGYALSKWASEKILSQAVEKGFTATIFRPSYIMGHSKTGITPFEQTHLYLLIKGCIQLGVAPKFPGHVPMLPVDYVADYISQISLQQSYHNNIYNLSASNLITFEQFIAFFANDKFPIKLIEPQEWKQKYLNTLPSTNALYPLAAVYLNNSHSAVFNEISSKNTQQAIRQLHLRAPKITKKLMLIYKNYLSDWLYH